MPLGISENIHVECFGICLNGQRVEPQVVKRISLSRVSFWQQTSDFHKRESLWAPRGILLRGRCWLQPAKRAQRASLSTAVYRFGMWLTFIINKLLESQLHWKIPRLLENNSKHRYGLLQDCQRRTVMSQGYYEKELAAGGYENWLSLHPSPRLCRAAGVLEMHSISPCLSRVRVPGTVKGRLTPRLITLMLKPSKHSRVRKSAWREGKKCTTTVAQRFFLFC